MDKTNNRPNQDPHNNAMYVTSVPSEQSRCSLCYNLSILALTRVTSVTWEHKEFGKNIFFHQSSHFGVILCDKCYPMLTAPPRDATESGEIN